MVPETAATAVDLAHLPDQLKAVLFGHDDIHQCKIGWYPARHPERILYGCRLTDNFKSLLLPGNDCSYSHPG